ncbi:MAG: hypothetical protein HY712_07590 [candidate division NC10 bacterium]|nr:hypothetical protein [candidate division NC10 bacterium]
MASTPLRWPQALGAAPVIFGVPALCQGVVILAQAIRENAKYDLAFAGGMTAAASVFLLVGTWLWRR